MALRSETSLAFLERVSPDRIEIRFKEGVHIDVPGIAAIFEERKRMQGSDRLTLLIVIPASAELELAVLGRDHFRVNDGTDGLLAMATVASDIMHEMLSSLFFVYFPQDFPSRVLNSETEARAWLDEMKQAFRI